MAVEAPVRLSWRWCRYRCVSIIHALAKAQGSTAAIKIDDISTQHVSHAIFYLAHPIQLPMEPSTSPSISLASSSSTIPNSPNNARQTSQLTSSQSSIPMWRETPSIIRAIIVQNTRLSPSIPCIDSCIQIDCICFIGCHISVENSRLIAALAALAAL